MVKTSYLVRTFLVTTDPFLVSVVISWQGRKETRKPFLAVLLFYITMPVPSLCEMAMVGWPHTSLKWVIAKPVSIERSMVMTSTMSQNVSRVTCCIDDFIRR